MVRPKGGNSFGYPAQNVVNTKKDPLLLIQSYTGSSTGFSSHKKMVGMVLKLADQNSEQVAHA